MADLAVTGTRTYELQLDDDGKFTFPTELRESLGLQVGDSIIVVEDENGLLLIPNRLLVPEFADYVSKLMKEKGITLSDLLASGQQQREKLFEERYGDLATN